MAVCWTKGRKKGEEVKGKGMAWVCCVEVGSDQMSWRLYWAAVFFPIWLFWKANNHQKKMTGIVVVWDFTPLYWISRSWMEHSCGTAVMTHFGRYTLHWNEKNGIHSNITWISNLTMQWGVPGWSWLKCDWMRGILRRTSGCGCNQEWIGAKQ